MLVVFLGLGALLLVLWLVSFTLKSRATRGEKELGE